MAGPYRQWQASGVPSRAVAGWVKDARAAVEVLDPDLSRRLGCCVPPEIDSRIDFITSENVDLVSLGLSVI